MSNTLSGFLYNHSSFCRMEKQVNNNGVYYAFRFYHLWLLFYDYFFARYFPAFVFQQQHIDPLTKISHIYF